MPFSVRLDDTQNPAREVEFKALTERYRIGSAEVIRALVEAYIVYEREHGAPATFPVRIEPVGKKE
jgi:hypothetical protein